MNENNALVVPEKIQLAIDTAMNNLASYIETDTARARIAHAVAVQIRQSEGLMQCSPDSITIALAEIIMSGLDPRSPNEAFLVPYKGRAVAQVGYAGLRKMALRGANVVDVWCDKVHANDDYYPDTETGIPIHNTPAKFQPRGAVIGYYAAAQLATGRCIVVEMSRDDVVKHKNRYSRAAEQGAWKGSFDSMAIKTCLRMLCHPRNMELPVEGQQLLKNDAMNYAERNGDKADPITGEVYDVQHEDKTPEQHIADLYGDDSAVKPDPAEDLIQQGLGDLFGDEPRESQPDIYPATHVDAPSLPSDPAQGNSEADKRDKLVANIRAACKAHNLGLWAVLELHSRETQTATEDFTLANLMNLHQVVVGEPTETYRHQLADLEAERQANQEAAQEEVRA